jgi:iron complex transport system substrate-binding protein
MFVHFNKVADVLGKTAEAKQWMEQYKAKAAKIKDQLAAGGKTSETATVMQVMNKQLVVFFESTSYTIYQSLGFAVPAKVKEQNKGNTTGFTRPSLEALPDYNADRIFVMQPFDAASDAAYKEILDSAVWKSLPAVQNKRVYFLDNKWGGNDPVSLDAQLDDIAKLLTAGK